MTPYITNPRKVNRVRPYLDALVQANGAQVEFADRNTTQLCYRIREGIQAAIAYVDRGEPYVSYAMLKSKYIFRTRSGSVLAEPRDPIQQTQIASTITLPNIDDALSIIGAAVKHKGDKLHFPNATAHPVELFHWTSKNGYSIISHDQGITLVRGIHEDAYVPKDEPKQEHDLSGLFEE